MGTPHCFYSERFVSRAGVVDKIDPDRAIVRMSYGEVGNLGIREEVDPRIISKTSVKSF